MKTYFFVLLALLVFLALSVITAPAGLAVSLLIAFCKIALIALFFMKLRHEDALGWAFATAGVLLGSLGALLMFADFLGR